MNTMEDNYYYYDAQPENYNRFRELLACKQLINYPMEELRKLINFLHGLELSYRIMHDEIIFLNLKTEQKKKIREYCTQHGLNYVREIKWTEDMHGNGYYNGDLNYITFKEKK